MKSKRASPAKRSQTRSAKASQVDRDTLALEFRRLRSLFQEVTDAYIVRVAAMIQRLVDHMEETDTAEGERGNGLSVEQYERIFTSIRRLDVNPKKGRRRDLKRIEELAVEIEELINK